MFVSIRRIAFVFLTLMGVVGCQGPQQPAPAGQSAKKVLARVNGAPITEEDLTFRLELAHGNKPQYGNKSVDDIISQELLYQQGLKLGLDKDPSYRSKLAKLNLMPPGAKRIEIARRIFNTQIASKIDIRYQDGKDYFEKNIDRITTELHLDMIKFEKRQEAEEALKKLRSGASFESVAGPVMGSTPVKGRKPWDLGFLNWDKIPVDFVDSVYSLKPGEVSEILGTQPTGFQIVKLISSRKIPKPAYPAVSATLMNRLRDLRLLEAYNQYVENLRKNAKIEKF